MSQRVTSAEAAQILRQKRQNVDRMAERHGCAKDSRGRYDLDELRKAALVGAELNKSKAETAIGGIAPGTLVHAKAVAQIQKLQIEIKLLNLELDKASGKLVAVDDAVACVARWGGEMATRIRVWSESEQAKNPTIAESIGRLSDSLLESIRDGVSF